ncbi:hypothetical protein F5X68DRAFT_265757 [Plectosphaerella plurivora]|uniref:Uncharacterized protein n=1 Tax=Plectosphaerella plurivora TaxID=936078 RepID=A0A9P8V2P6_9PEZI|nr:hypothetical protein F5X68DRAFT_265757 [Plectosphaerella plurivora]
MHHSMWQNWPLGLASYPLEFQDAYYKKITRLMNERYGLLDGAEFQSYEKSLECNTIEDLVKDTVILEELFCVTAISLKAVYRSVCMGIDPDALQSLEFASITNVDGYVEDAEVDIQACTGSWLHSVAHDMTSMHYSQAVIDQPDGNLGFAPRPRLESTFAYSDGGLITDQDVESATVQELREALVIVLHHLSESSNEKAQELASRIKSLPHKPWVHIIRIDIASTTGPADIIANLKESFPELAIDILVNNAGIAPPAALPDITPEHFSSIIATNLQAPLLMIQAAAGDGA